MNNYPKVIQLPITKKCNSRCVMCNVWNMDFSDDYKLEEFSKHMLDPLFKEVESVGINGGEPSLVKDLPQYIEQILKLPSLKTINIISHGFNSKRLLKHCRQIFQMCKKNAIGFHISISLDGVGNIHDSVRGIKNVFHKTLYTINEITENQEIYCHSFDIGCTVVDQNIDHLMELDSFSKVNNLQIKYRLGIENKRIGSDLLVDNYSVKYNKNKQTAKEFFHYKMQNAINSEEKFKYFSIFYWLNSDKPRRLSGCSWKKDGVTLDSSGNLFYCAVESNKIGSLRVNKGEDIFFNKNNLDYRQRILDHKCDSCIHDYAGIVLDTDRLIYLEYEASRKIVMDVYRIKAKLL